MKHIRLTLTILALLAFSAVSAFAAKYNFLIATDAITSSIIWRYASLSPFALM